MGEVVMIRKKHLRCPVCDFGRIADSSAETSSELRPENKITRDWIPDYFLKCPSCKQQIGIKKVS